MASIFLYSFDIFLSNKPPKPPDLLPQIAILNGTGVQKSVGFFTFGITDLFIIEK